MSKITLDEYLKKQEDFYELHVKFHPENAFCGLAGEEEMKHIRSLIDELSDKELVNLVRNCGFKKLVGDWEDPSDVRETCESVIDEISREDFYREYRNIIESKYTKK